MKDGYPRDTWNRSRASQLRHIQHIYLRKLALNTHWVQVLCQALEVQKVNQATSALETLVV